MPLLLDAKWHSARKADEVKKKHYRQHTTPNYEMGYHYLDHVMAMTQEDLHHKGEIAQELAVRDMAIESLQQQLAECQKEQGELVAALKNVLDHGGIGNVHQISAALAKLAEKEEI